MPFSAKLTVCSQSLSPVLRKEKQKPAKSLSFPYSLIFYKSHWEINIATRPSSSSPYPLKIPVVTKQPDKLQNKNRCGRKNDLQTLLPTPRLQFLHSARIGALFFLVLLSNLFLFPNSGRKGGENNTQTWKQQHEKGEVLLQYNGNCQTYKLMAAVNR